MDNNHQDEDGVTLAQVWETRTIEIMNPNYSPRAMTNPIKKALHTYLPTKAGRRMNMNNIQFLGHMMGRKLLNS